MKSASDSRSGSTSASVTSVHFHDIDYPFEYPDLFIFERRYSWNEAYAVRAFLMYNANYRVVNVRHRSTGAKRSTTGDVLPPPSLLRPAAVHIAGLR